MEAFVPRISGKRETKIGALAEWSHQGYGGGRGSNSYVARG
jgi:hypothetical protein